MPLDRRTFLVAGMGAAIVAACGNSDEAEGLSPDRLGVRFPDGFRAPTVAVAGSGVQRFPFVVIADDGLPMITNAPESLTIEVRLEDSLVDTFTIARRGAGQAIPFYPLLFTPPEAGRYVAKPDFGDTTQEFLVAAPGEVALFQVGDTLPGFDTPTFEDERGVTPICTRSEPCPFHEVTLTEAVANGRPTALLISTPEFCTTDVCGPSLEHLIEAAGDRSDINVVHAEVYADPRSSAQVQFPEVAPIIAEWQLDFEPSLFVADEQATIVQALHFAFDSDETAEAIGLV